MIQSMTGFGEASTLHEASHFHVEVRSVNNKFFKAVCRLPEEIAGLEAELEALLRKHLSRGSVTLSARVRWSDALSAPEINDTVLLGYLRHLSTVREKLDKDQPVHIDLTALLAMPNVLAPAQDQQALMDKARPVLMDLTRQATERLTAMRQVEGRSVADELVKHGQVIRRLVAEIQQRAPVVIEEYHQRLRARIDNLLSRAELKINEPELIREVAIFAERSDIAEETARLTAHLTQMQQIIDATGDEPAGRTLDFLAQELLREANTIASKSNDARISRAIVEVKGAIDRIKEQVQNIE